VQEQQQTQHILDLPKVAAGAVASPLAAILTSRFGVAGTMIGLALSAVVVTTISDILKVYLARVPGAVTKIPGGFKKKSRGRRLLVRFRLPFSKLSSLSPERRGYILGRSVIAGVIVFVIGLVIVTGLELSVGQDLSCWVWNNCASASPADGGTASKTSNTYTLPSILGGGASTSSNAPQEVGPTTPKQPASPVTPGASSHPTNTPGSKTPNPSVQSDQQQNPSGPPPSDDQSQSPSGASEGQQQSPTGTTSDDQPQSSPSETPDDQSLQSPSGTSDNQPQSSPSDTLDNQSQSPSSNSGGGDQQQTPSSSEAPQGSADQQQAPS
jgi:hypothetical protein